MTAAPTPGLLVLHGNRTEWLGQAVFEWLREHPLAALEEEVFLVQSNGIAEWLKRALAAQAGICAATRVELPARFLWRAYRQLLGPEAVPAQSALDKPPLTWRLMQLLPEVAAGPGCEPLAGFLRRGGMDRRLQLAQQLADLYDQYQVHRADWLTAWAAGDDRLAATDGGPEASGPLPAADPRRPAALPADQRWQATLWRALLAPLSPAERAATRPALQRRFVAALDAGAAAAAPLPRRVVLFGATHVPMQTLQALAALSRRSQVLLAIPNPCRYHWADTIAGRELLRIDRRRQPLRAGRDLAAVALEDMHAHAHPLLAAWGRQSRDFVRQLDAFDDALAAAQRFDAARVDLFDDGPGATLLQQVQAGIRDLLPLAEHPAAAGRGVDPADRSIVFHVAHSAQREVEILHDQLLALLAAPPGGAPLHPRDIVVMVPDIETHAAAVRAVFGQHERGDPRQIPFDIADLKERGGNPLLVAVEWLLRLPQQRWRASEVRDLLDVPALARRYGIEPEDLPRLGRWLAGAGVRWGLDAAQRADLGLASCGDQNSWRFGLRRMLLGYASGDGGEPCADIEPYGEVGGLDAALAGSLADLVDALADWWATASTPAPPLQWAARARRLLDAFFAPADDRERTTVSALHDALRAWVEACATAGYAEPVPLAVAREAWLAGVDEPALARRHGAGGVTFCTLLPMRAVPFEVVCLLGMNDGDYPRAGRRSDFDLMALPGLARPGDRSRRDDDRQLMLEALLSARRVLYVSWTGRSIRDHSAQSPSVLVSQLRDYLAAGWHGEVLAPRTTEHPLQPFSRRYFERAEPAEQPEPADRIERAPAAAQVGPAAGPAPTAPGGVAAGRLYTYASEWRAAHAAPAPAPAAAGAPFEPGQPLTIDALARFLNHPVRDFFRARLGVSFRDDENADDDEVFALDGLGEYARVEEVLERVRAEDAEIAARADLRARVGAQVARLHRAGRLPIGAAGRRAGQALADTALPMLERWTALTRQAGAVAPREPLRFEHASVVLEDWLDGLRPLTAPDGRPLDRAWLLMMPGKLSGTRGGLQPAKLIAPWVRTLAACACGVPVHGVVVGRDATVTAGPLPAAAAAAALADLLVAWRDGMTGPLPLARETALAWVTGAAGVAAVYEGSERTAGEVGRDPALARAFPDYAALLADGRFATLAEQLFGPLLRWMAGNIRFQIHASENHAAAATAAADHD